ncbi:hypothetical protein EUGRSUZ_G02265 [Eucalyptus grandis]|uniref:Uncharacterized protein n=2 Tax=Eucalyptus grandis TaxID=71139 RepID=A0ACC3K6L3_EUCGR|nr:hypothetical protein EUGRSUZ_G02265 [Eucalyptus grandis]
MQNQENEENKRESKTVGKRTGKKNKEGEKGLRWILGMRWLISRSQIANRIGIRVLLPFSRCPSKSLSLDPRQLRFRSSLSHRKLKFFFSATFLSRAHFLHQSDGCTH